MSNSVGIYFFHVNNNLVFATGSLEYDYQGTYCNKLLSYFCAMHISICMFHWYDIVKLVSS